MRHLRNRISAALAAVAIVACSEHSGTTIAPQLESSLSSGVTITVVSGNHQSAAANDTLPARIVIQANDGAGNALSGVAGTWSIIEGAGRVRPIAFTTNTRGRVRVRWELGSSGPQRLRATIGSASVDIEASITPPHAVFADANLEAAVRAALGVGPEVLIVDTIARRLTTLRASNQRITSLEGIQFFTALERIVASTNLISDLAPLADLRSLRTLELDRNPFASLGPLAGLVLLDSIGLRDNNLTSLSGLENKPELEWLTFGAGKRCRISDLAPIAASTKMIRLLTYNCPITSIEPLRAMTRLNILHIENTLIGDLSPLAGKPLWHLGVPRNPNITDVGPVATLQNLLEFHAWDANIADLSPVAGLSLLREVDVTNNQITSLEPLRGLLRLRHVMVAGNRITDIAALIANAGIGSEDMVGLEGNYLVGTFVVYPPGGGSYTVTSCGGDTADTEALDSLRVRVADQTDAPQRVVECRDTNGDGTPDTPVLTGP